MRLTKCLPTARRESSTAKADTDVSPFRVLRISSDTSQMDNTWRGPKAAQNSGYLSWCSNGARVWHLWCSPHRNPSPIQPLPLRHRERCVAIPSEPIFCGHPPSRPNKPIQTATSLSSRQAEGCGEAFAPTPAGSSDGPARVAHGRVAPSNVLLRGPHEVALTHPHLSALRRAGLPDPAGHTAFRPPGPGGDGCEPSDPVAIYGIVCKHL